MKLLIANRGEIAIRVARAAADIGLKSVAIYPADDADCLHVRMVDEAVQIGGAGTAAYLDIDQILHVVKGCDCWGVHPGYGFLAESSEFARQCADAGLQFVGPSPDHLELLGDKVRARDAAKAVGVPVMEATVGPADLKTIQAFTKSQGGRPIVIKAIAGGGGRGMRVVRPGDDLEQAFARCQSEAKSAFGDDGVFGEAFVDRARHVEVQIIGDGRGGVAQLGERDCTLQRRHQKIVEVAPAPGLPESLRQQIITAAVELARSLNYKSLGTFEFLVDMANERFAFIEANPRVQVEHTITEEVTGIDLVQTQLRLTLGETLEDLGLKPGSEPVPTGFAVQIRINAETMGPDGVPKSSGGTLTAFEPPAGPGIRYDGLAYAGYRINPRYDSLIAKLIVRHRSAHFSDVVARARRALDEFRIEGVETNIGFHRAVLDHPDLASGDIDTGWVDRNAAVLAEQASKASRVRYFAGDQSTDGIEVATTVEPPVPPGATAVRAPGQGTIVTVLIDESSSVQRGQPIVVVEAMKMETSLLAPVSGVLTRLLAAPGDLVSEGDLLAIIEEGDVDGDFHDTDSGEDPNVIRPELQALFDRRARTVDDNRPEAVAKRHAAGGRTGRENVADLVDPGTFVEYGQLVFAAQRLRKPLDELIDRTPADGVICGIGSVNGEIFEAPICRCVVVTYDLTVLAGTQGMNGHRKTDRILELAHDKALPVIFYAEGGGGRPGDVDFPSGFNSPTFYVSSRLSGQVPLVGINGGLCFAGNAGLLGVCDVVISTKNSSIGMGGPAMIEGGGLGVYKASEVGPSDVQWKNGVIDILCTDEVEATQAAKKYLSYFQGRLKDWTAPDPLKLRTIVPRSRRQGYRMMDVIEGIADVGSVMELRGGFGIGIFTALIRIEGRPVGVIANNPLHLGGAIDSDASDKAARFAQLCDAFDIPIVSLVDTPGIMVGPEAEKEALVRHSSRLFVVLASVSVPIIGVQIRKAYGLGGIAMTGGSYQVPMLFVAWPTAESGGMGIEAAVRLAYRKEMAAMSPDDAQEYYQKKVDDLYEYGGSINQSAMFKIDDTIDPAETRWCIASMFDSVAPPPGRFGKKKRPCVDAW